MAKKTQKRAFPTDVDRIAFVHPTTLPLLKRYVSQYGRIVPRYYTGVPLRIQKRISGGIKLARELALLPYIR